MKGFINKKELLDYIMKLNKHARFTLRQLVKNPAAKNSEIARQAGITSQAVGKIKKQLLKEGFIKNQELILDYEKLGIEVHAIALIKILPNTSKKIKTSDLNKILQPINVISAYALPETDVTHINIYAFRNITEYDNYFKELLQEFGEFVEIKHAFVFSSGSIIKSTSKNLFLKTLED